MICGWASFIKRKIINSINKQFGGNKPDIICGHSLGVTFAMACRDLANEKLITVSSPWMWPEANDDVICTSTENYNDESVHLQNTITMVTYDQ